MTACVNYQALVAALSEKNLPGEKLSFLTRDQGCLHIVNCAGGGLMNIILAVTSKDGKQSVILKLGTETPVSEAFSSFTLPLDRQELEYECMCTLHDILPGCVPEPYYFDKDLHIILMEDLRSAKLLSSYLRDGEINISHAAELGKILAMVQKHTHQKLVGPERWTSLKKKLSHKGMRDKAVYIRTDCPEIRINFDGREDWAQLHQQWTSEIKEKEIFESFRTLVNREDCFVHFDLHHQALFVKDDRLAMFDFEFGNIGHHAYALAYFLPFCIFSMLESQSKFKDQRDVIRKKTRQAIHAIYAAFISGFSDQIHALGPLNMFMSELTAFFGNTLFCYSLASTRDNFFIIDEAEAMKMAGLGMKLMREPERFTTIDVLVDTIFCHV